MTPTLVLVLAYFGVAVSSVIGEAIVRIPRLLSGLVSERGRNGYYLGHHRPTTSRRVR
jgi:hypothetical protein